MKLLLRICEKPLMHFVERDTSRQRVMGDENYLKDDTGKPKLLISVGWEFGSGGYEIAQQLAKRLGVKFYGNEELIPMEAEESGLPEAFIHKHEHNMAHSCLLYTSRLELLGRSSQCRRHHR